MKKSLRNKEFSHKFLKFWFWKMVYLLNLGRKLEIHCWPQNFENEIFLWNGMIFFIRKKGLEPIYQENYWVFFWDKQKYITFTKSWKSSIFSRYIKITFLISKIFEDFFQYTLAFLYFSLPEISSGIAKITITRGQKSKSSILIKLDIRWR